jgi:hypothetical protein
MRPREGFQHARLTAWDRDTCCIPLKEMVLKILHTLA